MREVSRRKVFADPKPRSAKSPFFWLGPAVAGLAVLAPCRADTATGLILSLSRATLTSRDGLSLKLVRNYVQD